MSSKNWHQKKYDLKWCPVKVPMWAPDLNSPTATKETESKVSDFAQLKTPGSDSFPGKFYQSSFRSFQSYTKYSRAHKKHNPKLIFMG